MKHPLRLQRPFTGACALALVLRSVGGLQAAPAALPNRVEFNRDIRPVLSDACFQCHGPDSVKRKAGLRLDTEAGLTSKLKGGALVVAGKPERSELHRRITTTDADDHMPPRDAARQLTSGEVELIRRWIEQGAKWEKHWAFIAPKRPALPKVQGSKFKVQSPIDAFILARLEKEGIPPAPEADKATLIRRVTLDLTGLPPTPAEVEAFLADASPRAFEKVVDRLLASPRYGERMAIRWLDAARYADTSGYQSDGERTMWRWRDWVIEAFNRNLPFDQFTIEQLAGDLLPSATLQQRIATGFNRNHRGNAEGGIVPAEYAAEYVVDRVDTTATVWLGLTVGCARCHDHKYDPVTQREFYQLFAFFNNVPEKGRAIKIGNSPPYLKSPTDAQAADLAALDAKLAKARHRLLELEPEIRAAQLAWENALATKPPLSWTITNGLQARFELDGRLASAFGTNGPARFEGGDGSFAPGPRGAAAAFDGRRFINCGDIGNFGFLDKFTLAAWIQPRGTNDGAIISRMVEQDSDSGFASDSEGYSVHLKGGRLHVYLTKRWLDDALRIETETTLAPDRWQHIAVTYDGSRLAAGVKVFVDGQPQRTRVLLDELNQTFQTKQPLRVGAGGGPANRFHGLISDARVYGRTLTAEEAGVVAAAESLTELAALPAPQRTARQLAKLRTAFLESHGPEPLRAAHRGHAALQRQRDALVESFPTTMVMEEMPQPRDTFVLKRGEYDKPGEQVRPGFPAALVAKSGGTPRNRLDFARWLVSPQHPLTARVAVNHYWQTFFGAGLVRTVEDFGAQGGPPSHPELLDWLATEFIRTGWNVKAMHKLIVMSATYRQSSHVTPELLARDPDNRLLARAPRVRLPAEMVRDQALFAAGLLVEQIGGPSVMPYQPAGLWKELSGTDHVPEHGEKLWRRSLYTFWKRTSPPPTMMTFDAAGREACSVKQSRTTTPLQALALMNEITFVEAARKLAERAMKSAGPDAPARLAFAFRLVNAREPRAAELEILVAGFEQQLARFRKDPQAALELVGIGEAPRDTTLPLAELAAFTTTANLMLNLDEAITRP
ncbi:MAG: hypothetical protein FD161_4335 [Limisphaerales bacterium]|nr:MAG: hypothetical protein FD161_4335 [Limisphaerales bacterium]KAG0506987.1 MAG: hypothetical protein E1N63_3843 [Limisphaerales bacterium]TXT47973.1 MAG: hypothetical protein FD140_3869 [Limisphaerales bacterium]